MRKTVNNCSPIKSAIGLWIGCLTVAAAVTACSKSGTTSNPGSGGASATGGNQATGGSSSSGGVPTTGGASSTGGSATTGGSASSGGSGSGRFLGYGGSSGSGGSSDTGGSSASGRSSASGGSSTTGGSSVSGGSSAAGGSSASGGSSVPADSVGIGRLHDRAHMYARCLARHGAHHGFFGERAGGMARNDRQVGNDWNSVRQHLQLRRRPDRQYDERNGRHHCPDVGAGRQRVGGRLLGWRHVVRSMREHVDLYGGAVHLGGNRRGLRPCLPGANL